MTPRHHASRAAHELIMRFEGYRRKAARLDDGRWTIGYGHTLTAREGAEVSEDDAEALLLYDVRPVAAAINEWTYTPLTQNQFDALVAFAFNVGIENFRRSSVLRRVNEGSLIEAACALEMWRKADFEGERIVVDALVRRRAAEKALFLTPSDGWIPAPSPILRPRVDYEVGHALPRNATELETSMTGDTAQAHRMHPAESILAEDEAPASRAAAEAVTARLSTIMPDEPVAPPAEEIPFPPPEEEPVYRIEPVAEPVEQEPPTPAVEIADSLADIAEPPAEPGQDSPLHIPFQPETSEPSRRVVWREAPMETEASRLLGADGLGRASPIMLIGLFLAGLAVFAGGIVWGLNTKGSGLISWGLGLVGIVCVVCSIYVYLERLGGRDE